jgi:PAS domain S-box-containing protein
MKNNRKSIVRNKGQNQKQAEEIKAKINRQSSKVSSSKNPENPQRVIEELHLNQNELEMQNEQLRVVSEKLSLLVAKYEDLYDFAPVGYVTLDQSGTILEANLTCSRLLHTDRNNLLNTCLSHHVFKEHLNEFSAFIQRMLKSEVKQTCELTFIRTDHTIMEVRLEGISSFDQLREVMQCRVAIIDISEQKATERNCRKAGNLYRRSPKPCPIF